ncbi:unnamed protein product [Fusarium venenatum]|uniref:Uncharacterized protein n=1 Tax=Fusarium venenatum TaxID=56646 RepID=A0A2L2SZ85_9HYPO|nr:uncharacterized protein FVRRES_04699 [Fusarium venenatum]CEI60263.1 unnamed protein product [Fusarium venenatum]
MPPCDCIYSSTLCGLLKTPSPGQRPDLMTKSPMRKLSIRLSSPRSSHPPPHIWALRGTKRTRADLCRSSVDSQSNALVHDLTTPSYSEYESDRQLRYSANSHNNENSASQDEDEPWYHKLPGQEFRLHQPYHWNPLQPQHHDLQVHRLKLQQLSTERFESWSAGVEYAAPSDNRLPPRKRFKASHLQSSLPRTEEVDSINDHKLALVSPSMRSRGFYHLACPFNIYAPARFQQCLMQDNICTKRDPEPIAGLNEDQKAILISRDCYYRGEKKRWCRIWSIVFPTSEPPQSPYLDRACGLVISMVRDFWELNGHQCVADYMKDQGFDGEGNENSHNTLFNVTLDDLLKGIIKEHESLKVRPIEE